MGWIGAGRGGALPGQPVPPNIAVAAHKRPVSAVISLVCMSSTARTQDCESTCQRRSPWCSWVVVARREGSTALVNGCDWYVDIACDLGIQAAKATSGR